MREHRDKRSSLGCVHTGDSLAMAVVVEREMRLGGDVALSFPPTEDEKCAFWIGVFGCVWAGITVDLPL